MSNLLTPESVAARPDASRFSPERLSQLRRIFEKVCAAEKIISDDQRDYLAANLLEASKFTRDEKTLVAVMKYDIAGLRQ